MCLRSMTATKRSRQREGSFSVINDGRSPGKTPSIRGDSRERKSRATEGHKSTRKETLVWLPFFVAFRDFLWPFPSCPSRAQGSMLSSRESPRSGVNGSGLRPSLIAKHSPRGLSCSSHVREAGRLFFSDQRRATPGKNAFPWRRFAGERNPIATKGHKSPRNETLAQHSVLVVFRALLWQLSVARHRRTV